MKHDTGIFKFIYISLFGGGHPPPLTAAPDVSTSTWDYHNMCQNAFDTVL